MLPIVLGATRIAHNQRGNVNSFSSSGPCFGNLPDIWRGPNEFWCDFYCFHVPAWWFDTCVSLDAERCLIHANYQSSCTTFHILIIKANWWRHIIQSFKLFLFFFLPQLADWWHLWSHLQAIIGSKIKCLIEPPAWYWSATLHCVSRRFLILLRGAQGLIWANSFGDIFNKHPEMFGSARRTKAFPLNGNGFVGDKSVRRLRNSGRMNISSGWTIDLKEAIHKCGFEMRWW